MKVLLLKACVWLVCAFVASAIFVGFQYAGLILGAIPSMIIFGIACFSARSICAKIQILPKAKSEYIDELQNKE